jgi:hypothetical protein
MGGDGFEKPKAYFLQSHGGRAHAFEFQILCAPSVSYHSSWCGVQVKYWELTSISKVSSNLRAFPKREIN